MQQINKSQKRVVFSEICRTLVITVITGLIGAGLALSAQAEPRISRMDQTVGTHFPYHSGTYRHWYGDRDIGLLEPFFPVKRRSYHINPMLLERHAVPRMPSRSRHVTGAFGQGSRHVFDVDGWYDFAPVDPTD